MTNFLSLVYFRYQDSWAIEKQFIAEQRSKLHQRLNKAVQKLENKYLTDITKLDQKETGLDERLRATLRYSSQPVGDIPLSPLPISPCTHLGAPSPVVYETIPWVWPPSMGQGALGIMADDQTPLFKTNSAIVRECGTSHQIAVIYYSHSRYASSCHDSA